MNYSLLLDVIEDIKKLKELGFQCDSEEDIFLIEQ